MAESKSVTNDNEISRDRLAELLNEDLAREYQAIIAYVVYSQVLSGAQQEQDHQIDLATALGMKVPDVSGGPKGRTLRKRR